MSWWKWCVYLWNYGEWWIGFGGWMKMIVIIELDLWVGGIVMG